MSSKYTKFIGPYRAYTTPLPGPADLPIFHQKQNSRVMSNTLNKNTKKNENKITVFLIDNKITEARPNYLALKTLQFSFTIFYMLYILYIPYKCIHTYYPHCIHCIHICVIILFHFCCCCCCCYFVRSLFYLISASTDLKYGSRSFFKV